MRKLVMAVTLLTFLALLVGACAPSPPSSGASPKPPAPPVVETPKAGGILSIVLRSVPAGFDLHRKPSYGATFGLPIFNNLVRSDPTRAETTTATILPDLAERYEASADGKTWTFYLRQSVKWHDGNPFSADDVIYSLEKMVDAKRSSLASNFPAYERSEKVDANTVKVYLKQPSPSFLLQVASPYAVIQPKHLAAADWRTTDFLVGTGPFKIKIYTSGVVGEFTKNPDYFKKGLPYLDGLKMVIIRDRSTEMDTIVTNRVDMSNPFAGMTNQDDYDRVKTQAKDIVTKPRTNTSGPSLFLNLDYAPLKDIRVRKAMALLIDTKALAIAAFGNEVWGDYDRGFLTGDFGLAQGEVRAIMGWDKTPDQRVVEAKKLMADAGYADGFKLRILSVSMPESQRMIAVMSDTFKRNLNIDCQIDARDPMEYMKARALKDYQACPDEALNPMGDPDELVSFFTTGGSNNFSKYSNLKLDELAAQQSVTMDTAKRQLITREIDRIILSDFIAIPLQRNNYQVAWYPYVKGFIPQNISYGSGMVFERTWMDK